MSLICFVFSVYACEWYLLLDVRILFLAVERGSRVSKRVFYSVTLISEACMVKVYENAKLVQYLFCVREAGCLYFAVLFLFVLILLVVLW